MVNLLTEAQIREVVEDYMNRGDSVISTQEILDSGLVPRLAGFKVKPGKVSDSIFGGTGSYRDKSGQVVEIDNPPLSTRDGIPIRIMVRTPRISTHDVNRGEVPFKDQVLAVNHNFMRKSLTHFLGNSQFDIPRMADTSVVIAAENLKTISFENVLRAYMAKSTTSTSLYQHFMKGSRDFCGHPLPPNLVANGKLPYVMDTPSTKSDEHDESISPAELVKRGLVTKGQYDLIRESSLEAFDHVSQMLAKLGLILVDTKTEHGINSKGQIVVQDEVYTMDSSRFWLAADYAEQLAKFNKGLIMEINPRSYSKEFARGMSVGDKGYTDEQRIEIAVRYIQGIQNITGMRFTPDLRSHEERVVSGLERSVDALL